MRSFHSHSPHRRLHRLAELLLLAGAVVALAAARLSAQTISPPIAEYQARARGSFQLTNTTLYPLTVVLELRGFRITEQGEVVDVPLDTARVQVKLSTMSFRIAPRATYNVFYEAKTDGGPAWFNILSAMSGARTDRGINLRIILPHVVYLNGKTALARSDVRVRGFEFDPAGGRVRVLLENTGPRLGRVLSLSASGDDGSSLPTAGFPLMPGSRRWTELSYAHAAPPDRLEVRTAKFTLDTALTATRVPPPPGPLPVLAADSARAPAR